MPLDTSSVRNPTEFGARALANTAFVLAGAGDLRMADDLLSKSMSYAPNDARLPQARAVIKKAWEQSFDPSYDPGLLGGSNQSVDRMGNAQKAADRAASAARQGRYSDALRGYEEAYRLDAKADYLNKATQAGIGVVLSGGEP
jgi:tetratricopeptide (TPR) repeat protein